MFFRYENVCFALYAEGGLANLHHRYMKLLINFIVILNMISFRFNRHFNSNKTYFSQDKTLAVANIWEREFNWCQHLLQNTSHLLANPTQLKFPTPLKESFILSHIKTTPRNFNCLRPTLLIRVSFCQFCHLSKQRLECEIFVQFNI